MGLLSTEQTQKLILATLANGKPRTKDEFQKVIDWAEGVLIDASMLQLVLSGELAINLRDDGQIAFINPPDKAKRK
jgi:hypothetical protein